MRGEIGASEAIEVAIVTMGRPDEAASFCRAAALPYRCLSDPARSSYRAYGLRRGGTLDIAGPEVLAAGVRAGVRGHFPGMPVGDVYQLGGVFLIDTAGRIAYAHHPRHAGDQPPAGTFARLAGAG